MSQLTSSPSPSNSHQSLNTPNPHPRMSKPDITYPFPYCYSHQPIFDPDPDPDIGIQPFPFPIPFPPSAPVSAATGPEITYFGPCVIGSPPQSPFIKGGEDKNTVTPLYTFEPLEHSTTGPNLPSLPLPLPSATPIHSVDFEHLDLPIGEVSDPVLDQFAQAWYPLILEQQITQVRVEPTTDFRQRLENHPNQLEKPQDSSYAPGFHQLQPQFPVQDLVLPSPALGLGLAPTSSGFWTPITSCFDNSFALAFDQIIDIEIEQVQLPAPFDATPLIPESTFFTAEPTSWPLVSEDTSFQGIHHTQFQAQADEYLTIHQQVVDYPPPLVPEHEYEFQLPIIEQEVDVDMTRDLFLFPGSGAYGSDFFKSEQVPSLCATRRSQTTHQNRGPLDFPRPSVLGDQVHKLETFGLPAHQTSTATNTTTTTTTNTSSSASGASSPGFGFDPGFGLGYSLSNGYGYGYNNGHLGQTAMALRPLTIPDRPTPVSSLNSTTTPVRDFNIGFYDQQAGGRNFNSNAKVVTRSIYTQDQSQSRRGSIPTHGPGTEQFSLGHGHRNEEEEDEGYNPFRYPQPAPGHGHGPFSYPLDTNAEQGRPIRPTPFGMKSGSERLLPLPLLRGSLPYTPFFPNRPPVNNITSASAPGSSAAEPRFSYTSTPVTTSGQYHYSGTTLPSVNDLLNAHYNPIHPYPIQPTTIVPAALRQSRSITHPNSNEETQPHRPHPGLGSRSNSSLSVSVRDRYTPSISPASPDSVIPSEISFESEEEEGGVEGQEGEDEEGSEYRPSKRRALALVAVPASTTAGAGTGAGSKGSAKIEIKVKPLPRPQPIQRQEAKPLNPPQTQTQIIHRAPIPLPPSRGTSGPGCLGPGPGRDIHSYTVVYYLDDIGYVDDADVKQTEILRRRCYNCDHRDPPSWRKSILAHGKILCNKCGIYERTHNRPRPQQQDDLKLRRNPTPPPTPVSVQDSLAYSPLQDRSQEQEEEEQEVEVGAGPAQEVLVHPSSPLSPYIPIQDISTESDVDIDNSNATTAEQIIVIDTDEDNHSTTDHQGEGSHPPFVNGSGALRSQSISRLPPLPNLDVRTGFISGLPSNTSTGPAPLSLSLPLLPSIPQTGRQRTSSRPKSKSTHKSFDRHSNQVGPYARPQGEVIRRISSTRTGGMVDRDQDLGPDDEQDQGESGDLV